MKKIVFLTLIYLIFTKCTAQSSNHLSHEKQMNTQNYEVELSENTRGFQSSVKVNASTINRVTNSDSLKTPISKEAWAAVLKPLLLLDNKQIASYKAPSNKRSFDGAMISVIKVKLNDEVFESQSFDSGNPPKELQNVYNALVGLLKTNEVNNKKIK